ncbi:LysR family transcriptional regulator [Paraburkholderia caribensis]|uniref:LysR family transcriptional regulator n=1 Tax=Paraburkholderia caribensis TaxID=75105 RepID=UPI0007215021|nr:LysR family transcriptional regulator [Paraburkholderia caribensis]ALP68508.1 GntR family transcriptional regulator [Paraburkholderia caribensis]AUT57862.1 GntR family transcriptional regulator [Paraburkholderia caribensis]
MVNPSHFDLQSLRVFALVAEHGSLTKAAEHGRLTLSAVSKRITDLESVTDCTLLVRRARGVELTAAGRGLHEHALRVLAQVNSMANEMSDFAVGIRGHVRVWANTSAIVQFLPVDLASFLNANRGVKVSLEERLSGEIVRAVISGEAELGIFADNVPAPNVERRLYRRDQLVLVVPQGHPFSERDVIRFVDTLDEDYVGLNAGSSLLSRMRDAALAAERLLRLRIQVSSFDGICRMIESGLGIGVLPSRALRDEVLDAGLRAVALSDEWANRTLWIGTKNSSVLAPEAVRLFDFLSQSDDKAVSATPSDA